MKIQLSIIGLIMAVKGQSSFLDKVFPSSYMSTKTNMDFSPSLPCGACIRSGFDYCGLKTSN